ncbi:helix-turn-helix domain-containing protein [Vibrio chagasii]|nr:helix-turn-helix domain-containing protein [Vibrio chagasii]
MEAQGGIVARAADMLGMRRTTLVEKMRNTIRSVSVLLFEKRKTNTKFLANRSL